MSSLTIDALRAHPLFSNLVSSFPDQRNWLNEANINDLVEGLHPSTMYDQNPVGFDEYFVKNLLKKTENLDLGLDPDQVAFDDMRSFLKNQEHVNQKVKVLLSSLPVDHDLTRVLQETKRWFSLVFKGFNPNSIIPRYTLGATLTLPRGVSVFDRYKSAEGANALRNQNFWLMSELEQMSDFEDSSTSGVVYPQPILTGLMFTPYSVDNATSDFYVRLEAVPKTASISRIIGISPSVVLSQQVGLGDYLTKILLKHCRIDLSTAPDIHKGLAMEGSLTGDLCTMDQRKASDNILRILCEYLLPPTLFQYMSKITPNTLEIQGERVTTHMMCPAGNGYIFPFQTMLFWALIRSTQIITRKRSDHWVFGDDVIIASDIFNDVKNVFEAIGLQINEGKSFNTGPFRESCGGDYIFGSNVRPLYVKRIPASTIDWIRVINGIRRIGYYNNAGTWRSDSFRSLWLRCIRTIPVNERLFCPRHYGDAGINSESERLYTLAKPSYRGEERIDHCGNIVTCGASSPKIKVYNPYIGGTRSTFADVSKGIPADDVIKLLLHPSVVGSGGNMVFNRKTKETKFTYPHVYNGLFEGYRKQNVPLTPLGTAPDDIDELFSFLEDRHPDLAILDSDSVVERYNLNKKDRISELANLLTSIIEAKQRVRSGVLQDLATFSLSHG